MQPIFVFKYSCSRNVNVKKIIYQKEFNILYLFEIIYSLRILHIIIITVCKFSFHKMEK
jgi:hypothetical protein